MDLREDARRMTALNPPLMRGLMHLWAIPFSLGIGAVLIAVAPTGQARLLGGIFALSVSLMFGASALFHRGRWTEAQWWRMRRVDQTGIYVVIAGSYTGMAGLALSDPWRTRLVVAVWIGALAGILIVWLPFRVPFGLNTAVYAVIAASIVPRLGELWNTLGTTGTALICISLALYGIGALCLGFRFPNPAADIFGYHEVWHTLVIAAIALQYCTVLFVIFPLL